MDITKSQNIYEADSKTPTRHINFSDSDLGPDYSDFDVIIIAEQLEKQKFTFISLTYDSKGGHYEENPDDSDQNDSPDGKDEGGSKTGLIVIISIISVVIIGGGIVGVLIFLK